ncbi:MAG: pilus assembly protein TadG-related protein [Trebonia sp.]
MLSATVRRAGRDAARRDDRGSVAVFTAVFAFAVLLLIGLLVDGGDALNARERAADVAEQAARAAVTDLSIGDLHGQSAPATLAIDWSTACTYAQQTITDYGADTSGVTRAVMANCGEGTNPLTATVTVTVTSTPAIPVPGFEQSLTMTATQSATAACGNADKQEVC